MLILAHMGLTGAFALALRAHGFGRCLRRHDALVWPDGVQHDAEPQASHHGKLGVNMRRKPPRTLINCLGSGS
jgi:hypothetical protein